MSSPEFEERLRRRGMRRLGMSGGTVRPKTCGSVYRSRARHLTPRAARPPAQMSERYAGPPIHSQTRLESSEERATFNAHLQWASQPACNQQPVLLTKLTVDEFEPHAHPIMAGYLQNLLTEGNTTVFKCDATAVFLTPDICGLAKIDAVTKENCRNQEYYIELATAVMTSALLWLARATREGEVVAHGKLNGFIMDSVFRNACQEAGLEYTVSMSMSPTMPMGAMYNIAKSTASQLVAEYTDMHSSYDRGLLAEIVSSGCYEDSAAGYADYADDLQRTILWADDRRTSVFEWHEEVFEHLRKQTLQQTRQTLQQKRQAQQDSYGEDICIYTYHSTDIYTCITYQATLAVYIYICIYILWHKTFILYAYIHVCTMVNHTCK